MKLTARERKALEEKWRCDNPPQRYKDDYERFLDGMDADHFALFETRVDRVEKMFDEGGTNMSRLVEAIVREYTGDNLPASVKYMFYVAIYGGVDINDAYEAMATNFYRLLDDMITDL